MRGGAGRRRSGAFLYDPDPAVVRSHLVAEFAAAIGGRLADPEIAYVYTDEPADTPFGRRLEITDVLPFSLKRLRTLLRERGVGRLEIRKRGSALEPDQLRRDLRLSGTEAASLVLTRVAGAPTRPVCGRCEHLPHGEEGGRNPGDRACSTAREGRRYTLHPYDVSPDSPNYGALVAEALGVAPERVFKTLIAEVDGAWWWRSCR